MYTHRSCAKKDSPQRPEQAIDFWGKDFKVCGRCRQMAHFLLSVSTYLHMVLLDWQLVLLCLFLIACAFFSFVFCHMLFSVTLFKNCMCTHTYRLRHFLLSLSATCCLLLRCCTKVCLVLIVCALFLYYSYTCLDFAAVDIADNAGLAHVLPVLGHLAVLPQLVALELAAYA